MKWKCFLSRELCFLPIDYYIMELLHWIWRSSRNNTAFCKITLKVVSLLYTYLIYALSLTGDPKFIFIIQNCICNWFFELGLSLKVDRHPEFRKSRCLFVVRTDGVWIDFSYQKCLRAYIREKYPSHAERFIGEHFKRTWRN